MNSADRARLLWQEMAKRGYTLPPGDDGVRWWMPVVDRIKATASVLFVLLAVSTFCAFIGALFGFLLTGFLLGLLGGAIGLLKFKHRLALGPHGLYLNLRNIWAGMAPHDAQVGQGINTGLAVCIAAAFWAGIGAMAALLLDLPVVVCAAGAAVVLLLLSTRDAVNQQPVFADKAPDHHDVAGAAAVAATLEQIKEAKLSVGSDGGFFLGTWPIKTWRTFKDRYGRVQHELCRVVHWLRFDQETGGVLLFAPPGSGKGTCFVLTTLLSNLRDTFVCIDPASQNIAVSKAWLEKSGVEVHRFDPTGMQSELLGPLAQCNPLGSKDINSPTIETELHEDAAIIVRIREGDNQSYFSAAAQVLFFAVALFMLEIHGAKATYAMVADMLHLPIERLNDLFSDMTRSRFPSVRNIAHKFFVPFDDEGRPLRYLTTAMLNVIENAQQDSSFLSTSSIARMFGGNGVDFADGKKRRAAYFVCVPEAESVVMQKCVHLLLATMKRQLCTKGGLWVNWIIDEMCSSLPSSAKELVLSLANTARKFRNRLAGICQSYPQYLEWCGNAHAAHALRAAIGGCLYHGANDPETIAEIQREAGQRTVWQPSTAPLAEYGIDGATTPIGVDLLTPEALRDQLRDGMQTIFLLGSRRCVIAPRTPYFQIPELASRASPDPYHQ